MLLKALEAQGVLESPNGHIAVGWLIVEDLAMVRQVVLVGYGRVGRRIAEVLAAHRIPFVVVEQNRDLVRQLRDNGMPAVSGNASEANVLIQAHIAEAGMLVIATPETVEVRAMVEIAKTLNPAIKIVVRTHNEEEAVLLENDGADKVFVGERELARSMTQYVLDGLGH